MSTNKKIALTGFVRFYAAGIALLILLLNARYLGKSGVGTLSLAILGVTLIQNIMGFVTGSVTYWVQRWSAPKIFFSGLVWILLVSIIASPMFAYFNLLPDNMFIWPAFLAALHGLNELLQSFLVGRNNIKQFNRILLTIHTTIISAVLLGFFQLDQRNVIWILQSMALGYSVGIIYNLLYLGGSLFQDIEQENTYTHTFKMLLHHGFYIQMANFFQKINLRLTYYFVEAAAGIELLGLYAAGIQLSEGLWNLSRSIATVEYGIIANTDDANEQKQTVRKFLKLSGLGTLALLLVLIVVPESVYVFFLGEDFENVKSVIYWLSPGVLIFSISTILVHYFTGIGRFRVNMLAALIAVPVTVIGCWLLVGKYGLNGAAMTQNIAYLTSFIFLLIIYNKAIKD